MWSNFCTTGEAKRPKLSLKRDASYRPSTMKFVVWPALVRVINSKGERVLREDGVLFEKIALETLSSELQQNDAKRN